MNLKDIQTQLKNELQHKIENEIRELIEPTVKKIAVDLASNVHTMIIYESHLKKVTESFVSANSIPSGLLGTLKDGMTAVKISYEKGNFKAEDVTDRIFKKRGASE